VSQVDEFLEPHIQPFKDEIARLQQTARDLEAEIKALPRERRQIEENAGDALLDARFAGDTTAERKVAKTLEDLRIRQALLEQQIAACQLRIEKKRLERDQAIIKICQEEATARRKQAEEHWKHTEELLRQINEYEECDYFLKRPESEVGGPPVRIGITERTNRLARDFEIKAEEVRRNARYMEQVIERKRREIARAHSESIDDDDEEE